ncbi:MAG: DUF4390 domain-containing protein [Nitrospirae bacterium]|nr:DUF4390 domain-containing protein [Nitrospirota bacterium]
MRVAGQQPERSAPFPTEPAPAAFPVRRRRRIKANLICFAVAVALPALSSAADTGRITDLTVKPAREQVTVSASLAQGLSPDVGDELQHGISKILYYYVVLKRHVPFWMDEELDSSTVRFRIWYDLVKRQFVVAKRQGETETRQTVDRLDDVNRLISHIRDVTIPLAPPSQRGDTRYYVSVRAEMRSAKLPVYIEYVFFFLPVAQLSTPWTDSAPFSAGTVQPAQP